MIARNMIARNMIARNMIARNMIARNMIARNMIARNADARAEPRQRAEILETPLSVRVLQRCSRADTSALRAGALLA